MTPVTGSSEPGMVLASARAKTSNDNPPANALLTVYGNIPAGANGKVLQADSTNPLGFSWVDAASASTVEAKGDLFPGSGPGALVRLPVGEDGEALTADSAAPGGVSWSGGLEDLIYIGAGGGAPAFNSTWANFGAGERKLAFYKDRGRVYFQGLITDGAANLIFTLPVGYRPTSYVRAVFANAHVGGSLVSHEVRIDPDGKVNDTSAAGIGSGNFLSFEGLNYRIDGELVS